MDCHRSFEFDRYPFDDILAYEYPAETLEDRQAFYAEDITHGMETAAAHEVIHEKHAAFHQPR